MRRWICLGLRVPQGLGAVGFTPRDLRSPNKKKGGRDQGLVILKNPSPAKFDPIPPELDLTRVPTHVACVMDGNGRWAKPARAAPDRGALRPAKPPCSMSSTAPSPSG